MVMSCGRNARETNDLALCIDEAVKLSVSRYLFPFMTGRFWNHLKQWLLIVRIRSPKSLKASLRQVWRRWLLPNPRAGVEGI